MSKMQVTSVKKGRAEEKQKPNEDTHGRGGLWWLFRLGNPSWLPFSGGFPLCHHCLLEDAARSCKAK